MIKRQLIQELILLSSQYKVVTLTGPRQAGKTTLARQAFPDHIYVSLEDPDKRALAIQDPRAFLALYPAPVIYDEIQRVPELLSWLQGIVDASPARGQFILTGSHQLALSQAITQSLAGRTALLTLYPLSISELTECGITMAADEYMQHGFMPAVHADAMEPVRYYRNYYETYVERDVRQMLQVRDMILFDRFLRLCAGRVGQLFIANHLANEVGVSSHTINHWLSILEASFIVLRLQPFHKNIGKRLVKAAKLYFVDVGLASYLLGIENTTQLARDPLRGNLFENMVVMELFKARANQGKEPRLCFYRDSNENEVDVVFGAGNKQRPIEIKSAATFSKHFFKGIEHFYRADPQGVEKGFLIYDGDMLPDTNIATVLNFRESAQAIKI